MTGRFVAIAVAVIANAALACGAESGGRLSLQEAVGLALRENPTIRMTRAGQALARAQLAEAKAGWFPSLQASETFTRSTNPVAVFGALLEQDRFGPQNFLDIGALNNPRPYNNFRAALTSRWALFDQFQTATRVTQSRLGTEQADLQRDLAEQQVRLQVIRAYFGVLHAAARRTAAEAAIRSADADVARSQALFDVGTVVRSDLLGAQVQLAEFRQEAIQAAGEVASGLAALNAVLGLPIVTAHRLTGELAERAFVLADEDALLRIALQRRPDYLRAISSLRSAEAGARGAAAQYLPRVEAFGTYGGSGREPAIDSTDYTFGAVVSVDLFDAGRRPRVAKARAAVTVAAAERDQAAARVSVEVVQSLQGYRSARERLAVAAAAVAQAEEALRIGQDRYQEGLTTMTEVLRASATLLRARTNRLASLYEYYVGYAGALAAAGTLADVSAFE